MKIRQRWRHNCRFMRGQHRRSEPHAFHNRRGITPVTLASLDCNIPSIARPPFNCRCLPPIETRNLPNYSIPLPKGVRNLVSLSARFKLQPCNTSLKVGSPRAIYTWTPLTPSKRKAHTHVFEATKLPYRDISAGNILLNSDSEGVDMQSSSRSCMSNTKSMM